MVGSDLCNSQNVLLRYHPSKLHWPLLHQLLLMTSPHVPKKEMIILSMQKPLSSISSMEGKLREDKTQKAIGGQKLTLAKSGKPGCVTRSTLHDKDHFFHTFRMKNHSLKEM